MVVVKDIMNRAIETVKKDDPVYKAAELMSSKGISCLVITDEGGKLTGIITRRDILEEVLVKKLNPEEVKVSEIMASPVITVNENASLVYAAGIMKVRNIKQIPVISDGNLVGIITQTDLVLNINTILGFDEQKLEK